ncbi:MAG: beta-ketoacyl synthase N-terminal-like domain-containing protein, partial [Kiritimatiellia bacterium]|nr:beta-ketoacyl synthase N-terminal-like domain-containing protein [Kiritimatiellia bacterium]
MRNRNRVVVTGMGVVAPNGIGLDPFWSSLLSGQSAIGPITLFDAAAFPSRIAGEVRDFKPELYLDPEVKARRLNRFTQFALIAAEMARKQAGLTRE